MNKNTILVAVAAACLIGCAKSNGSSSKYIPLVKPDGTFCYPGRSANAPGCFPIVDAEQLAQLDSNYRYADPHTTRNFPASMIKEYYEAPHHILDIANSANIYLTPNFKSPEFFRVQNGNHALFSSTILNIIQRMRTNAGAPFIINSGYRSPGRNEDVDGSATWSRHMYGDAVDFYSTRVSLRRLKTLCLNNGADYTQLYAAHIHCDWRYHSRDVSFFNPVGPLPGPAVAELATIAQNASSITYTDSGSERTFATEGVFEEDADAHSEKPLHEWRLYTPSGDIVYFEGSNFTYNFTQPGEYQIQVEVGGNILLSDRFTYR